MRALSGLAPLPGFAFGFVARSCATSVIGFDPQIAG
jgi:hypothetical protein